jgi:hypothetical protein
MSKSILVAFANQSEQNVPLTVVEKWEPEKMSFFGDTVFFKVDDMFASMKKIEFCNIFREKCGMIKY